MKKYIILAGSMLFASLTMQSCLDFDDPGAEMNLNDVNAGLEHFVGDVNHIPFQNHPTVAGVDTAIAKLDLYFKQAKSGQYCLRGGKNGDIPGAHAYQRQYSLGPDTYAQYFVVPHKDFMYGSLTSSYNVSADFNNGPLGAYTMAKNAIIPLLNHPMIDSIPEMKAINLLYYCLAAQEMADLSGPFTYLEDKLNSEAPETYNNLEVIYKGIVENLDTIVACLENYDKPGQRDVWYKERISKLMTEYCTTHSNYTLMDPYVRLANSLKLRMAIHIAKVDNALAKKWATEAIKSGVIQGNTDQHYIKQGFHPLADVVTAWNDLRLCASFESLLMSLDHPYTKYLFKPNNNDIVNQETGEITPTGDRICGIRAGVLVDDGQQYGQNMRQAYSTFDSEIVKNSPLYLIKRSEVDFLCAEAILRWPEIEEICDYSIEDLYEYGIRNAFMELTNENYGQYIDDYLEREEPVDYVNIDPYGDGEIAEWPSVTKIGVAWNDSDTPEKKLEKIITQKYLALFPLSTEAWTELRRTGFPKLFQVLNTDDGDGSIKQGEEGQAQTHMIRRIPWVPTDPIAAAMVNSTGLKELAHGKTGAVADDQATRLWWDVEEDPNFNY
ncbi:MAG: SusD/RagB family nutrient-binding outer membrane lipoprotein [Bacteroidaceae bacterium]|nr:SusD/RagB family nutrient-binding outer membrane lipoprotein [Bacteroidaceae bacterium]